MTDVDLPETLNSIGNGAFAHCDNLTSINIPNSVTSIGDGAFNDCINLTTITIPEGVTTIGTATFANNKNLTSIFIPISVNSIANNALAESDKVTIYGFAGSYAEQYANESNIPFVALSMPEENNPVLVRGKIINSFNSPVSGINVLLYDEKKPSIPIASATTNMLGEWSFNRIDADSRYEVAFYSQLYSFNPSRVSIDPNTTVHVIAEKKQFNILDNVFFEMRQNGEAVNQIQVGTTVSFHVEGENFNSVQLVVDEIGYEEYLVDNFTVDFDRKITKGGIRTVYLLCKQNGEIIGKTREYELTVNSTGVLESPVIISTASGTAGQDYVLEWNPVQSADSYTVYLYHNSFLLNRWTLNSPQTNLTMPGNLFYESGIYAVEIIASGTGYSQQSGFSEITFKRNPTSRSISGIFVDDSGIPVSDVTVALLKNTLGTADHLASAKTNAEGKFSFAQLTPNCEYMILYHKDGYEFEPESYIYDATQEYTSIVATALGDGPLYLSAAGLTHWKSANTQTVIVYSPYEWDAATDDEWFTFSRNENELFVSMTENNTGEDREGSITVTSNGYRVILPVTQQTGEQLQFPGGLRLMRATNQYVLEKSEAKKALNFLFGDGAVTHSFLFFGYKPKDEIKSYWRLLTADTKGMTEDEIRAAKKEFITVAQTRAMFLANGVLDDQQRTHCMNVINQYARDNYMKKTDLIDVVSDIIDNADIEDIEVPMFDTVSDKVFDIETWNAALAGIALYKDKSYSISGKYMVGLLINSGNLEDWQVDMLYTGDYDQYSDVKAKLSRNEVKQLCDIINHYKTEVQ